MPTKLAIWLLLLLLPGWAAGQLLEGEFGNVNLGRPLVDADRFPTVAELRAAVRRPEIAHVLMFKLYGDENNHFLPVWSPDGRRLAFQRTTRSGTETARLLLFASLNETKPLLLGAKGEGYDYMFRWGLNSESGFVFARIEGGQQTRLYYSDDNGQLERLTPQDGEFALPDLYERTDGIRWLAFERQGELLHRAWKGMQSAENVLGRGTSPRWSRDGRRLLYLRDYSVGGQIARYRVAARQMRDEKEVALPTIEGAVLRSPTWSPDEQMAAWFVKESGNNSPWQLFVSPLAEGAKPITLVRDVVVNPTFKSEGPSWEPSGRRVWCFSHTRRQGEYYPLVAADVSGNSQFVDYPRKCSTPFDLAVNPATAVPELAFVGRTGATQDLFVVFLNHF